VGLTALQVSVDHVRTLNATSVELQEGQQHLEPAVRDHREHLLTLLQDPQCQENCTGPLSRARALELDADFRQVQVQDRGLLGHSACCPRSLWTSQWSEGFLRPTPLTSFHELLLPFLSTQG
jgi:hypothetical protein